jgi:hypothetical protein
MHLDGRHSKVVSHMSRALCMTSTSDYNCALRIEELSRMSCVTTAASAQDSSTDAYQPHRLYITTLRSMTLHHVKQRQTSRTNVLRHRIDIT